jgi:hypothetical protein
MAQDMMDLPHHGCVPSVMSPSESMMNYLQRIGASLSVSLIMGMQKKYVIRKARLHKPKEIQLITGEKTNEPFHGYRR